MGSSPTQIRKPQPAPLGPAVPGQAVQTVQTSIPTRRGDVLRLTFYSSLVFTASVIVRSYINGEIQNGQFFVVTDGTRAAQIKDIDLTDGLLIGVYVSYLSGTVPVRGQCFVKGEVRQGINTPAQTQLIILSNYVTGAFAISYPTSALIASTDGNGLINTIGGSGGGATFTLQTVPTNTRYRVFSSRVSFNCDVNPANRAIQVQYVDSVNGAVSLAGPRRYQVASEQFVYFFGGYSESTAPFIFVGAINNWWVQMPQAYLRAGGSIQCFVANNQVGDTNTMTAFWEEWLDV